MSFTRYSEYRNSKLDWFDSIPSHWSIEPCRSVFIERNERNDPLENEDYLSLMANIGVLPYEEKGDIGNKKPEDLGKCKQVYKGDLVINSMNYGIGSYGLSQYRGVCSPVYIVLTPKKEKIEERFAFRILETKQFQKYAQSFGNGILEHRAAINWDILKIIGVPVPPIEEQRQILSFLDLQTTKIDELIVEQEKLIELLKEKRQAEISHAVTKGLEPSVKTKDSGIKWLGEIPVHWSLIKLKFVAEVAASNVDKKSYEGEIPCLLCNYTDVYYNETITNEIEFMPATASAEQVKKFSLRTGDVIITKDSESPEDIGVPAYVPKKLDGVVCGYHLSVIRSEKIDGKYISRLIASHYIKSNFAVLANGLTRYGLGQYAINNIYLPIPPKEEAVKISEYIEETCSKVDGLIAQAKESIALLIERRSALVAAAITGQIDVRNAPNKPEAG